MEHLDAPFYLTGPENIARGHNCTLKEAKHYIKLCRWSYKTLKRQSDLPSWTPKVFRILYCKLYDTFFHLTICIRRFYYNRYMRDDWKGGNIV